MRQWPLFCLGRIERTMKNMKPVFKKRAHKKRCRSRYFKTVLKAIKQMREGIFDLDDNDGDWVHWH